MIYEVSDGQNSSPYEVSDNIPRYKQGEAVRVCGECEIGQMCYQYKYDSKGNMDSYIECDECLETSYIIPIRVAK